MATYGEAPVIVQRAAHRGRRRGAAFHAGFGFGGAAGRFSEVHVAEPHRHHVADDPVIIEQTLSGAHTGVWQGLQPTGRSFSVEVCTVCSFGLDGKPASERVYLDLGWLRQQLMAGLSSGGSR